MPGQGHLQLSSYACDTVGSWTARPRQAHRAILPAGTGGRGTRDPPIWCKCVYCSKTHPGQNTPLSRSSSACQGLPQGCAAMATLHLWHFSPSASRYSPPCGQAWTPTLLLTLPQAAFSLQGTGCSSSPTETESRSRTPKGLACSLNVFQGHPGCHASAMSLFGRPWRYRLQVLALFGPSLRHQQTAVTALLRSRPTPTPSPSCCHVLLLPSILFLKRCICLF